MGASRRLKILSMEGIVSAMRPGCCHQIQNLARAYGVRPSDIRRHLEKAVEEGMVDVIMTPRGATYRLVWSAPVDTNLVAPAYRNLRLSETLVNYERNLHQFQALCMMVRK